MITYFYDNEVKKVKTKSNGLLKERFIVYAIEHDGNVDRATQRVKTAVFRLGRTLAGGYFNEACIPYNFKRDYTCIAINPKERIRPYDKQDKFIINLIESEI
jgi:hypothetical protein